MPEYWTILANDVMHVRPIRALGIYETREAAAAGITPEMLRVGAYVVPLVTGYTIAGATNELEPHQQQ